MNDSRFFASVLNLLIKRTPVTHFRRKYDASVRVNVRLR